MQPTRTLDTARHRTFRSRGLTLIELLVGIAISSLIIVGTVFVYSQSRTTTALNEKQARLQEYGRYVLGIIEPDLQLAGYYGFSNNPSDLRYKDGTGEYPTSQLEQTDALPLKVTAPAAIHTCGNNFVIDLLATVQGTNAIYGGPSGTGACGAKFGYQAGTDTLTIRRASTAATAQTVSRIQIYANALKRSNQYIFSSNTAPGPMDATREVHDLIVRMYYISQKSDGSDTTPSLRRKFLTDGPSIGDEEILPGVEDMQVQFGIDAGDHKGSGKIDMDDDKNGVPDNPNGVISRYVAPDDNMLKPPAAGGRKAQVVAVRIWLRIRSDETEVGFKDTHNYTYAGINYTPAGADQGYRRVVVSRTIFLRNARTL